MKVTILVGGVHADLQALQAIFFFVKRSVWAPSNVLARQSLLYGLRL
jgi:hypothetical protein